MTTDELMALSPQQALDYLRSDEFRRVREDAARYRWLRGCQLEQWDNERPRVIDASVVFWKDEPYEPANPDELDAAIDAAREEIDEQH